jgi:L-alanine-DL-glutamate epimerase-like enolase superfamily enzyme
VKLEARTVAVPMRAAMVAGHGTVRERELVLIRLQADDGVAGWGEAAPLASYDGVRALDVRQALAVCGPVLEAYPDATPIADILARCSEVTVVPQALAAIDLALWDLAARRVHEPVWRLLGATRPVPIPVNWTLSATDRSGAAREAAEARAAGFETIKVKVGIGDDAGRLAAVRAFGGPRMAIRIDANGVWSAEQARAALAALAPVDLELCEEPASGLAAIAALHEQTDLPLALDESAGDPSALDRAHADLVCLKIARCGGITGLLEAAGRARAAGYGIYLASTLDGPLGIAAALHAAAVLVPDRACGLATLGLLEGPPSPLTITRGTMRPPPGDGLGDRLAEWYPAPGG